MLPEELRINSESPTIQKMQLMALLNRNDLSRNMREHILNLLRELNKKYKGKFEFSSQRMH